MTRKIVVPAPISRHVRTLKLTRSVSVQLFTRIHNDVPESYAKARKNRTTGYEDSQYRDYFVVEDEGVKHLFSIDDATSGELLILVSLRHDTRK